MMTFNIEVKNVFNIVPSGIEMKITSFSTVVFVTLVKTIALWCYEWPNVLLLSAHLKWLWFKSSTGPQSNILYSRPKEYNNVIPINLSYTGKHCRPGWNAAYCSISSGSALFASLETIIGGNIWWKGYLHLCPRMDFLQTLHNIDSLYTNYENVWIESDS